MRFFMTLCIVAVAEVYGAEPTCTPQIIDYEVRILAEGSLHGVEHESQLIVFGELYAGSEMVAKSHYPRSTNRIVSKEGFAVLMSFEWSPHPCHTDTKGRLTARIFVGDEKRKCMLKEVEIGSAGTRVALGSIDIRQTECSDMTRDCRIGVGDADVRIYVQGRSNSVDSQMPVTLGGVACRNGRVLTNAIFPNGSNVVNVHGEYGLLMAYQWSSNLCADPGEKDMSFVVFYEREGHRCLLKEVEHFGATYLLDVGDLDFSSADCLALAEDPCDPR